MNAPRLPVNMLDDGLIECGDYDDWATACSAIKRYPDDRVKLDELLRSIPEEGLREPLWIEVSARSLRTYLIDGHHRAVALMELGIKEFPYRWRWRFPKSRPRPAAGEPLPDSVLQLLREGS